MGLTHTDLLRLTSGHKRVVITESTFDSSYPTGGEPLAAADLGLVSLDVVLVLGSSGVAAGARHFQWDRANSKLLAFNPVTAHTHAAGAITMNGHVHVENEAGSYTQSANTASTTDTGSSAASAAATAGPGTEVANAVSLATVKVHLLAIGS